MDKQFGKNKNQVWSGVKIRYERDDFTIPEISGNDINEDEL
jgi:hypothetical protein